MALGTPQSFPRGPLVLGGSPWSVAFMQEKGGVSRIQITKSLPTKKRAIREVTMVMTKNATVA